MPPCDFTPERYQSFAYTRVLDIHEKHLSPALTTYFPEPLLLHQGHMEWLFDYQGNRYLDFFSGIVTVSVGHCHPKVNAVAQKQMGRLWHTSCHFFHPQMHEYAEKLSALLPEPLKVIFLINSGSEANDLAMLMARAHSHNTDIISFRGGYHGSSPYTLSLSNVGLFKMTLPSGTGCQSLFSIRIRHLIILILSDALTHQALEQCAQTFSVAFGEEATVEIHQCKQLGNALVHQVPRGREGDCCQAKDRYIEQFKDTLNTSVAKSIAGFFVEPIQGVNGVVQYPKGFLKEAFKLVRERGGVCVADEVQTGFGRLGSHFWGFQTHGVLPDIVTMAKGIANGFPMAAVVTTPEIAKSLAKSLCHFNTFGGNPMACAIGSAVLEVIKEENLQENSHEVGIYMLLKFAKLRDEFEIIGDVRGKGLMIGIEMVKDKTFRIAPSMCVTKPDADFAVEVFRSALIQHMERKAK
ncbi:Alanine--glyoxylate aminotransferase 2, mitochondrial [Pteropus alecto]|uniref:Alanine--glyoxylate aminotransferase 2, mitochondrial n=1 Tax=Pteropus alecto TaxID=9402 RepID=L5K9Z0_PTEAL|nr:Alanine--glyoxylate aminotransferase 2, mitochondrial [Pteropus alecto]